MADTPMQVFISYSRADRDFALRLQASLQARGIDAWVDLRRLEGGQEFDLKIEEAIKRCFSVLVVLSPDAVASQWVRREIIFAQQLRKAVIPLMLRETYVPVTLAEIQYLPFIGDYEEGLKELLIALYRIGAEAPSPLSQATPAASGLPESAPSVSAGDEALIALVPPAPPLPLPDPDLNALYLEGIEAELAGDLERAAVLWQQVLDRQPGFRGGQVEEDMAKLAPRLHASRVRNAREEAEAAMRERRWLQAANAWQELANLEPADQEALAGVGIAIRHYGQESHRLARWNEAIGAWEALLRRDPADAEASEYLTDAQRNREQQPLYDDAKQAMIWQKPDVARVQLGKLYDEEKAPYYGDPDGIAKALNMGVRLTLPEAKLARDEARLAWLAAERKRMVALQSAIDARDDARQDHERMKSVSELLRQSRDAVETENEKLKSDLAELEKANHKAFSMAPRVTTRDSVIYVLWLTAFTAVVVAAGWALLSGILGLLAGDIALSSFHHDIGSTVKTIVVWIASVAGIVGGVTFGIIFLAMEVIYRAGRSALRQRIGDGKLDRVLAALDARIAASDQQSAELDEQIAALDATIKGGQVAQAQADPAVSMLPSGASSHLFQSYDASQ